MIDPVCVRHSAGSPLSSRTLKSESKQRLNLSIDSSRRVVGGDWAEKFLNRLDDRSQTRNLKILLNPVDYYILLGTATVMMELQSSTRTQKCDGFYYYTQIILQKLFSLPSFFPPLLKGNRAGAEEIINIITIAPKRNRRLLLSAKQGS